jgi:serine/threonine-protein kinase
MPLDRALVLLDAALSSPEGLPKLRDRFASAADAPASIAIDRLAEWYDELVGDPKYSKSARARARLRRLFRDEANSVANLRHDHIVSISDYGEHEGAPFLAMDLIDGETLDRLIRRGAPIALEQKLQWMEHLCEGLAYAHGRHLVHRDIKPANLIIEDGTDSLKILDFGIVRRLRDVSESTVGLAVGTLCYMSPEQMAGSAALDHRSDIFAVGDVMYELLSGTRAFPANDSIVNLMHRIQSEPPAPIRSLLPDIRPELERILDRALAKDPAARYQSLTQMRHDIARVRMQIALEAALTENTTTVPVPPHVPVLEAVRQALAAGDVTAAATLLEQARHLAPTAPEIAELAGEIQRHEAERVERQRADRIQALHVEADAALADRRPDDAAAAIEELTRLGAATAAASLAARAEELRAALAQEARVRFVARVTAQIDEAIGQARFDDAVARLDELRATDPSRTARARRIDDARAAWQSARDAERVAAIERLLRRAQDAREAGDWAQAVARLEQAAASAPESADIAALLADARRQLDAHVRAADTARQSLEDATTLLALGKFEDATSALAPARHVAGFESEVTRLETELAEAWRRARDEQAQREFEAAITRVEDLLRAGDLSAAASALQALSPAPGPPHRARIAAIEREVRRAQRRADKEARARDRAGQPAPHRPDARLIGAGAVALIVALAVGVSWWAPWRTRVKPDETTAPQRVTENGKPAAPAADVLVSIDLQPWARVKVVNAAGVAIGSVQTTPFVVPLPPGQYRLECENGGVSQPETIPITVEAGPAQSISRALKGFDPDAVLNRLLGRPR